MSFADTCDKSLSEFAEEQRGSTGTQRVDIHVSPMAFNKAVSPGGDQDAVSPGGTPNLGDSLQDFGGGSASERQQQ